MEDKDRKKYFIRSLTKVFKEGADTYWWLNVIRLVEVAAKYDFDEIKTRIEMIEEDEDKKRLHPKTIKRALQYCQGDIVGKEKKDPSVTIETIKEMGKALCNDEYAFLIKIEPHNVMGVMKQADEIYGGKDISIIYSMLNKILYELEQSSYYSFVPGTKEDGFNHYDMKLQHIRREVDNRFWNNRDIKEKLYQLIEEEETMVKSYSRPGAPERWVKYNPNLRFYDCVYDFIENNAGLYKKIKNGEVATADGIVLSFKFYPDEEDCIMRKKYFETLAEKNGRYNTQYTIDRFYQNELVAAFQLVFEADFTI